MNKPTVGIVGTGIYLPENYMTAKEISEKTNGIWAEEAVVEKLGIVKKRVPEYMVLDNINALEEQSTYVKFDECGHSPLVDKPEELTKTILSFIE